MQFTGDYKLIFISDIKMHNSQIKTFFYLHINVNIYRYFPRYLHKLSIQTKIN